ncbi:MAG: class I SAM-dependent methyltransferase, partial [Propionibacteriaceae bacterium]
SRDGLLRMVEQRPAIRALEEERRSELLGDVAALYDSMSRAPEPLLLPYQAHCTRAVVCQDELSIPISYDDGLKIF